MFDVFDKLLKEDGRVVVLCANTDAFFEAIPNYFMIKSKTPILLSGKKAVILVLVRSAIMNV
jgi:hypothetical protein